MEKIVLHVGNGDSRIRVVLQTVRKLAVPTFLVTSFIDKCINGIFQTDRKMVPFNSRPVPILVVIEVTYVETTEQLTKAVGNTCTIQYQEPTFVCVERTVIAQPSSETTVLVASSAKGLVRTDAYPGFEHSNP